MSWVATAIIGSAVVGAYTADQAASAQSRASGNAIDEQRRQFDLQYQDQAPYREAGTNALANLSAIANGDFSSFQNSPGYQFTQQEGERALARRQSATGNYLSGAGVRESLRYNNGLASQEFGNYWNRQAGLAGVGQASVAQTGQAGQNAAANIGNAEQARGNAFAQGQAGLNNAVQGGVSNYMLHNYLNGPQNFSQAGGFQFGPTNPAYGGRR